MVLCSLKEKNTVKPQFNEHHLTNSSVSHPIFYHVPWPFVVQCSERSAVVTLYQIFGIKLISDCVTESVSRTSEVSFFCYRFYCVTMQNKSFNYKFVLPCLIELFFHFLSQSHKCTFPGNIRIIDNT